MTQPGTILVINAGSSSIKFAVYRANMTARLHGQIEGIGARPHLIAYRSDDVPIIDRRWDGGGKPEAHELLAELMAWLEHHLGDEAVAAVGHRLATGGLGHSAPLLITGGELSKLRALVPLAPLHLPRNLEPIETIERLHPGLPQVACFDTAFHRTLPREAARYALPRHVTDAGGCRYGFHGLSYEYIAGHLRETDAEAGRGRTVIAHLGSGASLCALHEGRSIATTMGFSPLSGLMMASRPGQLDAGLMIWLVRERGMSVGDIEHMLYHDCGLKGVSGISGDMRELLASSEPEAREAVEQFVYSACREISGMCAALQGLDALVFTAGIGENAPQIRARICERLGWLGISLDERANARNERRINAPSSSVEVLVVATNEELVIARHTSALVTGLGRSVAPQEKST